MPGGCWRQAIEDEGGGLCLQTCAVGDPCDNDIFDNTLQCLYLDFTDSAVKSIFRVFYGSEWESSTHAATVLVRFKQFQAKKRELLAECARRSNVAWAKLAQIDEEPLWIRIKDAVSR